jgi:hypothetical protein
MTEPKTRPLAEKLGGMLEILCRQLFAFEALAALAPKAEAGGAQPPRPIRVTSEGFRSS